MVETSSGRTATRFLRRTRLAPDLWQPEPEAPVDVVSGIAPRPLLIVHGSADTYFPMRHPEALAEAAPDAEVWIEPGMGHAEVATTADLLERIAAWVSAVYERRGQVCDDDRRD
jgi:fermentation-respiration switch protein FrsA (DUF1100 family)